MSLYNPFVIQCVSCSIIIGDSFGMIDYKNNCIVLVCVGSNTIEKEGKLECKCGKMVGMYKDNIEEECDSNGTRCIEGKLYYIDKKNITTYVLGHTHSDLVGIAELSEEINKLQKFCTMLYEKINNKN